MIRGRLAALAVALAGCGKPAQQAGRRGPDGAAPLAASADAAPVGAGVAVIPDATTRLITVVAADASTITAEATLWARDDGAAPWRALARWPVVLGRAGLAWGRGQHGAGAPAELRGAGASGADKREGDGKSPAGVFALGRTFGYGAQAAAPGGLPHVALTAGWRCVDDPASGRYNQVFDASGVRIDWGSAEVMRRDDVLYQLGAEVAHNPGRAAGAGSCIFLHVWADATAPTAGCTAMAEPDLARLLAALAPAQHPRLVQLTAADYAALAAAWRLPPSSR
ncbi:MAG: hypothetical protein KBG28_07855 [Kofleriaceae bacterium]|nr:hypothetical protein [Kofleriaceae bacterium]